MGRDVASGRHGPASWSRRASVPIHLRPSKMIRAERMIRAEIEACGLAAGQNGRPTGRVRGSCTVLWGREDRSSPRAGRMRRMHRRRRREEGRSVALEAGREAPEFSLSLAPDRRLGLRDFAGKRVVLAFYPADWSPVCTDQLAVYNELLSEFRGLGAEIIGISVDGMWCHAAFAKDRKLHFPLLADFEPKGEVSRAYGVYRGKEGVSERA